MSFSLLPTMIVPSVARLTPEFLREKGIQLLMLDFDNTIVPYTTDTPDEEMEQWLQGLSQWDIGVCVVSNSRNDRVVRFCADYGIDCITRAKKPFSKGIAQCLQRYHIAPENSALAGDQIFTDTLGANCAGVHSVLVTAIDNHNVWLKLRHVAELPFIFLARKRRVLQ